MIAGRVGHGPRCRQAGQLLLAGSLEADCQFDVGGALLLLSRHHCHRGHCGSRCHHRGFTPAAPAAAAASALASTAGDTPEAVEYLGLQNLVQAAAPHLGMEAGQLVWSTDGDSPVQVRGRDGHSCLSLGG